jgi:hypothetical protein
MLYKSIKNGIKHSNASRIYRVFLIIICGLQGGLSSAGTINSKGGFLSFNLYPYMSDVDSDNSLTINAAAQLNHRFSYFSLTNFSNQAGEGELEDTENFYTEQNIRWQVSPNSPLDLTLQMNFRSGVDNDRHRLGVRWRLNNTSAIKSVFDAIHLLWSINFHPIQFDNEDSDVWQIEHSFRLTAPYLRDRLYLAGFIDHTFNEDLPSGFPDNPVVSETQLGFRLIENLYVITEYRINQYRRADVNNLAVGIEYKIRW